MATDLTVETALARHVHEAVMKERQANREEMARVMKERDEAREELRVTKNKLALTSGVSDHIGTMLIDYEMMRSAIAQNTSDTGYCIFCEQHKHADGCPIAEVPS